MYRSGATQWGSRALIVQEKSMKGFTDSSRPISRIVAGAEGALADAELAPDPGKGIEDPVELVGGVRGHHGGAQPAGALGHGGGEHLVGEHAAVVELLPEHEGVLDVAGGHGDDGRLAHPGVEA